MISFNTIMNIAAAKYRTGDVIMKIFQRKPTDFRQTPRVQSLAKLLKSARVAFRIRVLIRTTLGWQRLNQRLG